MLALALSCCVLLALGSVSPAFPVVAAALAIATTVLVVIDVRSTPVLREAELSRDTEQRLSIAAPQTVTLRVRNPLRRALRVTVRDEAPASFTVDRRSLPLLVPAAGAAAATYVARPRHRGTFAFGRIHARPRGVLDLVERQSAAAASTPAHVYPDLREIRRYEVTLRRGLAYDAGQRRARLPGAGGVFSRLRDYQPDDDPRAISWKATARRGRPMSVEYEAERQQRVLVLLDSGRMMASTLGELTKLDHAVNTALMLAYVATVKGDDVGLLAFADQVRAYAAPRRGRRQFLRLTEELRRAEVSTGETDYRAAFEHLRARAARRSLAVLFTDLVDEDASRGLVAAVTRLAGEHLVLCCLLADPLLLETATQAPRSTQALYERLVARDVRDARERALASLRRRGAHVIDVPADKLTVATIQRYLEIKQRLL